MISLEEFRTRRAISPLTESLAELSFTQLFEQWLKLDDSLTQADSNQYQIECTRWRDLVGIKRANEIMDEVRKCLN